MAWEGIIAALNDAQANKQPVVESEHLMKALIIQRNGLVRRIFSKAGLSKLSVLQATLDFLDSHQLPKVEEEEGEPIDLIIGEHLELILENAGKQRKKMGDENLSVVHFLLAFFSDERFGQQLFSTLQISKKDMEKAIEAQTMKTNKSWKKGYLEKYGEDLTELARRGKIDRVIGREEEIERCIHILSSKMKNNPLLIGDPGVGKTAIAEGIAQRIVDEQVPQSLLNTKLVSLNMGSLIAGAEPQQDTFEKRLMNVLNKVTRSDGQIILFIDEVHTIVGNKEPGSSMSAGDLMKPALGKGELRCIGATTFNEYTTYIEKDSALERRFQPVHCSQPSVEDTILILHGLQDSYQLHHGVKISTSALNLAATLADRYITDRFFPDKEISLIDEAAAHLNAKNNCMPIELKKTDKFVEKLEIEKFDLLIDRDRDDANKEKLRKIDQDLSLLYKKQKELTVQWNHEKSLIIRMRSINEAAERELRSTTKHKVGKALVSLHCQLEEIKKTQASGNSLLRDEVIDDDIAEVISNLTGIPLSNLQQSEKDKLFLLERVLHESVIGQDTAVASIANVIRRSKGGLCDLNRPTANFMFTGPTGVGKTELAKVLASYLFSNSLIRVDMTEYTEKHSISRLVGSPPGYVGHQEGGQLTELVRRRPYSIVLFDEVEKAHPEVITILLRILDEGRVTDAQGRPANFTNCIVIMTSNIGSDYILETVGKMKHNKDVVYEQMREHVEELASKTFPSEFMSRIGEFIVFLPLDSAEICMVVEIQIQQLRGKLKEKNIGLQCTKEAVEFLGKLGHNPRKGARLLRRVIDKHVKDGVAEQILRGTVKEGDTIIIDVDASSSSQGKIVH